MDEDPEPGDSSGSKQKVKKINIGSVFSKRVKPNPSQWLKDLFSDKIRYKTMLKSSASISTVRASDLRPKRIKQRIKNVKTGFVLKKKAKKKKPKQRFRDVFSDTKVYKSGIKKKKKKSSKVYVIPKAKPLPRGDADRGKKMMGLYPELFRDEDPGYVGEAPHFAKHYRDHNPEFAHIN